MSSYNELIKNYEKIREIMREFYVYGFKHREEYDKKSLRSYDDERRRLESWLGDYMKFIRTAEGKRIFISIDSRAAAHNPFFKTLKSKSFTDGDITLHFILFDILHSPEESFSLKEILEKTDEYLSVFKKPMVFDESTIRKKLNEYIKEGIISSEKSGRKVLYRRMPDVNLPPLNDALNFYSEVAPCGVIGSFLLDKMMNCDECFRFKHHYIMSAIDSEILANLFMAMREKSSVIITNMRRNSKTPARIHAIPLKILISAQNGRQHLLAYHPAHKSFKSFRIDYISCVETKEYYPQFDDLREDAEKALSGMWGVIAGDKEKYKLSHIDFTVRVEDNEKYIVKRLYREKRVGKVEKIDENTYKFSAEVYDVNEMIPWLRTFICRITDMNCSDELLIKRFKDDLEKMYDIYGIREEQ